MALGIMSLFLLWTPDAIRAQKTHLQFPMMMGDLEMRPEMHRVEGDFAKLLPGSPNFKFPQLKLGRAALKDNLAAVLGEGFACSISFALLWKCYSYLPSQYLLWHDEKADCDT